jgi:DNA transformation protein and related proteins
LTPSAEYREYVLEQLESIGPLQIGRFFGGVGISKGYGQFAMIMGNNLYFVVDDGTRQKYAQAGMQPFSYMTKKGRVQVRRYFELPEEVLTDPIQLQQWAKEAMCIADRPQKPKQSADSFGLL